MTGPAPTRHAPGTPVWIGCRGHIWPGIATGREAPCECCQWVATYTIVGSDGGGNAPIHACEQLLSLQALHLNAADAVLTLAGWASEKFAAFHRRTGEPAFAMARPFRETLS